MQITNKFAKKCCVCGKMVGMDKNGVGEGFAAKNGGPWQTYCVDHAPERIVARQVVTERKLASDGYITMPYEAANIPLLKTLPIPAGRRSAWDPDKKQWVASMAEQDRMRVLEIADRLGLNVDPSIRGLSALDQVSALPDTLYPFQKKGVEWLSRRDRGILGDDMGTGKTCQALFSLSKDDRTLVVCPASLKYNWEAECKRWRPDLNVRVINAADGRLPIPKPGDVIVINYDILPKWLLLAREDMPTAVSKLEGITLLVDEAHFLGNWKSQRSKKITMLSEKFAKRVLFLTGTAMTRDPKSLWSVLSAAGVAREAFGGWTRYTKLFNAHKDQWGGYHWGTPDATVPELLRRVMLRRTRAEVLPDLPSKTYTDIVVNGLSSSLRSTLDSFWSEQGDLLETEAALPGFEEFSKIRAELAAAKIPAMLERVQEHEDQNVPLLVCSDHRAPVEALKGRPGWGVIMGGTPIQERDDIVQAFQNGTLKGVAFTTLAGGVGLNLQRAWKMLHVDMNWTPANILQAYARMERIGQKSSTIEIERMIIDHPLERHIFGIVAKKVAMAQAAIENSIAAQKLQAPAASINGTVKTETQAEYDARMEALRLAAEEAEKKAQEEAAQGRKSRAKSRVAEILERERVRNPRVEQPMSPERVKSVQYWMGYMDSVCDGAYAKDNQGFNKADSFTGKTLAAAGLETEDELRAAEYILIRYSKTQVTLEG